LILLSAMPDQIQSSYPGEGRSNPSPVVVLSGLYSVLFISSKSIKIMLTYCFSYRFCELCSGIRFSEKHSWP